MLHRERFPLKFKVAAHINFELNVANILLATRTQ